MQTLMHRAASASGAEPESLISGHHLLAWWANLCPATDLRTRVLLTLLGAIYICAIGLVDLVTPAGMNFDVLYFVGCAFVGWTAGAMPALLTATLAGTVLLLDQTIGGFSVAPWAAGWNLTARVLGFAGVGWLGSKIASTARGLEKIVRERTSLLHEEVEQHKETADYLAEALQLFRQVTENIADVFWVTNATRSQVEYVSPEFRNLWGETCQSAYDSPSIWLERIHHEDRERVTRALLAKQLTGHYDEEYRVVRPDGSLRWVRDRAFPVKDDTGAVYRLVGIAEDITERKRTQHLLQAERDIAFALSSTNDLKSALDQLLQILMRLEGIECGGIYLARPDSGELRLEAHRGLSDSFLERISQYKPDALESRLARTGRTVYLRREEIPRSLEVFWGREGLRALLVVPIRHKGAVLGLLNLASYREDEIAPETRIGVEVIASQVAGALARMAAEESLRRSEAHLRSIVNSAPIALLAADASGVITFEDGKALQAMGVKPGEHLKQSAAEVYADFPLIVENIGRALTGEDFTSTLEFDSNIFECHYTPFPDKDRRLAGFISVATDVTERFRLQREILEISDREQARIGQDVHDGLCQQLIGMALNANSLAQGLAAQQRPEAAAARKICGLLDEAITESRRVCRGLYPVRLETEGLVPALEELAHGVSERYKVQCQFETDAAGLRCNARTATHLYRIAQEAVNNAIKHSGGNEIKIRLTASQGRIQLMIHDNGKGLASTAKGQGGMGLHIMDYRARSIGSTLRVTSGETGTLVSCRAPQRSGTISQQPLISSPKSTTNGHE